MPEIQVDGKPYEIDHLSPEARTMLGNLQFVENEIARHNNILAVLQTARAAYAHGLKVELEKTA